MPAAMIDLQMVRAMRLQGTCRRGAEAVRRAIRMYSETYGGIVKRTKERGHG